MEPDKDDRKLLPAGVKRWLLLALALINIGAYLAMTHSGVHWAYRASNSRIFGIPDLAGLPALGIDLCSRGVGILGIVLWASYAMRARWPQMPILVLSSVCALYAIKVTGNNYAVGAATRATTIELFGLCIRGLLAFALMSVSAVVVWRTAHSDEADYL